MEGREGDVCLAPPAPVHLLPSAAFSCNPCPPPFPWQLPAELGRLSSLAQLYAFGSSLSGTLPKELFELKRLQEIELSHCRLTGTLPSEISHARSLRYIFLESNQISGSLPPSLASLRGLREIEISDNRLSGSVPKSVASMRLDHLDVSRNPNLEGGATLKPKQGCSGGGERYLRGQQSSTASRSTPLHANLTQ